MLDDDFRQRFRERSAGDEFHSQSAEVTHRNPKLDLANNDCDSEHPKCQPRKHGRLFTRLVHLTDYGKPAIKLIENSSMDIIAYVALSHPWGKDQYFYTTLANIKSHQTGIDFEALPAIFKHAVIAGHNLGLNTCGSTPSASSKEEAVTSTRKLSVRKMCSAWHYACWWQAVPVTSIMAF